ncbi:odorant receptor 46a [Manduca sexta]|uniref:odorant receptor 46a n=1 Tax=Manduca sexta TaxID=7130 RepID=UPI00118376A0|nr:odorant receptor 46a [Manduca sexta]
MERTSLTLQLMEPHFTALAKAGYYEKVFTNFGNSRVILHNLYRVIVWILIITYNLQHLIRVIQVRKSIDMIVDILFILLTTLNALGKQVAFNTRSHRIKRILHVINGRHFSPRTSYHTKVIQANALVMSRLLTLYHIAIFLCGALWTIFPIINRASGATVEFTAYFPFDTATSPRFELALAYMSILITLQAYGNVTMDCTIIAFYAQAKTQIRILRHDLEMLVKSKENTRNELKLNGRNRRITYKDESGEKAKLQQGLAHCVEHYRQIAWISKEVESTFGEAMTVQFVIMAWVICMTVYKIIGLEILSAEFVSMAMYLGCMLAQLFIYCYFGTQLKVESELVNQSVYRSDWLAVSPRFRRQLLIMMCYCSQPITPRAVYVIPMSLDTYITVGILLSVYICTSVGLYYYRRLSLVLNCILYITAEKVGTGYVIRDKSTTLMYLYMV